MHKCLYTLDEKDLCDEYDFETTDADEPSLSHEDRRAKKRKSVTDSEDSEDEEPVISNSYCAGGILFN